MIIGFLDVQNLLKIFLFLRLFNIFIGFQHRGEILHKSFHRKSCGKLSITSEKPYLCCIFNIYLIVEKKVINIFAVDFIHSRD